MARKTSGKQTSVARTAAAKPAGTKKVGTVRRSAAAADHGGSAAQRIDRRIAELADWRGNVLQRVRQIIRRADPQIVEEWKWETPAWSHDGLVCTGESYKNTVKFTFARGASLEDPSRLFNSSLDGKVRRAIDVREADELNESALRDLVRAAVALNLQGKAPPKAAKPALLAGGNPQIPKGYGDGPVQAYIAAMPGWKREVGRRLDELIVRAVPGVRKAVKWNSPLYGVAGEDDGESAGSRQSWFLGVHCFARYVKVAFFRGASLRPVPPGPSKQKDLRYLDIYEDDELDEAQFTDWVKQARHLPGERM